MNYCSKCGLNYGTAVHNCQREIMGYASTTLFVNQGWQCPICLTVYSPSTPSCWKNHKPTITITSTTAPPEPKKPEEVK